MILQPNNIDDKKDIHQVYNLRLQAGHRKIFFFDQIPALFYRIRLKTLSPWWTASMHSKKKLIKVESSKISLNIHTQINNKVNGFERFCVRNVYLPLILSSTQ
jgi:hypothetical protein